MTVWCDEVEGRRWGLQEVRECMSGDHMRQEVVEECWAEEGSGRRWIRRMMIMGVLTMLFSFEVA